MQGTVDGFTYGAVTPVAAYAVACIGAALGLRCTVRSLLVRDSWRAGWLALGAVAIGSGVWSMHFIAMMGFTVDKVPITYDKQVTFASLAVAIVVVGIGVFVVGYRGSTPPALITGGLVTGLGVAAMHYLGMAGMRMRGQLRYEPWLVGLSIGIAVVAATAALWAAVSVKGFLPSLGASLVMGVAVSGMHYTGMWSVSVHAQSGIGSPAGSVPAAILAPVLLGPVVALFLIGVVVVFDPLVIMGKPEPGGTGHGGGDGTGTAWARGPERGARPYAGPTAWNGAGTAGPEAARRTGARPGTEAGQGQGTEPAAGPGAWPGPATGARRAPRHR